MIGHDHGPCLRALTEGVDCARCPSDYNLRWAHPTKVLLTLRQCGSNLRLIDAARDRGRARILKSWPSTCSSCLRAPVAKGNAQVCNACIRGLEYPPGAPIFATREGCDSLPPLQACLVRTAQRQPWPSSGSGLISEPRPGRNGWCVSAAVITFRRCRSVRILIY